MALTDAQLERYSRHIILKEVGGRGQQKLLSGSVLIIGAGGLGAPAAMYLAAAGVGRIGLVDFDTVDLTNLQRQIIHFTADLGKEKTESAAQKMKAINPEIRIDTHKTLLNAANIKEIITGYDFIIDGTDNFPAKFLLNDACVLGGKAFSHGGILRFEGQTMTHTPGKACYRCIFRELPPRNAIPKCSEAGVLGAVAGMLGTIQAAEALKYLLGIGELLVNRLLIFEALEMKYREVRFQRNKDCPVCGEKPSITELSDYEQAACDIKK